MQTKGRIMLMVIAGGYLAYLGGGLVTDAMKEKPENYILYTVVGVLFLIIGAACCLFNLKKYIKHEYRDPFKDAIEEDGASEEDAEPSDDTVSVEEKENISVKESETSDESDGINSCGEEHQRIVSRHGLPRRPAGKSRLSSRIIREKRIRICVLEWDTMFIS